MKLSNCETQEEHDRRQNRGCGAAFLCFALVLTVFAILNCRIGEHQATGDSTFVREFGVGKVLEIYCFRTGRVEIVLENPQGRRVRVMAEEDQCPVVGDMWDLKAKPQRGYGSGVRLGTRR